MSYNLMVEWGEEPDWQAIHQTAMASSVHVDYFPISDGEHPPALGICLPRKGADEEGWRELRSVLLAFSALPGASIIDMYSGMRVRGHHIDRLRRQVLEE